MSTSLEHLLPAPDQSVRCAEHSREIGIDPAGTAIRADVVYLVETPLPLPKPALDHPTVAPIVAALAGVERPIRVLCTPVSADSAASASGGAMVTAYHRRGSSASRTRYQAGSAAELVELAAALTTDPALDRSDHALDQPGMVRGGAVEPGTGFADRWLVDHDPVAPATILICTQGSHDVCCGAEGARLVAAIEASDDLEIEVHRVSHTGGHRFAPTGMTLPDGRMWAGLDLDTVARILAAGDDGRPPPAASCRGWWGADPGPAQVAERALLAELGWEIDQVDRTVTVETSADGQSSFDAASWLVTAGERSWRVLLAEGREVPTIACREPGGLPAKPAREYDLVELNEA